jgi:hypothetical protein
MTHRYGRPPADDMIVLFTARENKSGPPQWTVTAVRISGGTSQPVGSTESRAQPVN